MTKSQFPLQGAWNSFAEFLAQAPLVVQAPLLILAACVGCGVLALVWLRIVDRVGVVVLKALGAIGLGEGVAPRPQGSQQENPQTPYGVEG